MSISLQLESPERERLWRRVAELLEAYAAHVDEGRVAPELEPEKIRALLAPFDFTSPRDPLELVDFTAGNLSKYQVHTPHARYFGLFNPAPTTMGIVADALVAGFNPQMAAWSHSPLAVEIEHHLIRAFGARFGYDPAHTDGTFCSGGAEANHTALCAALESAFVHFGSKGVRALPAQPVFYASAEAHHSFSKAARLCGIGGDALREVAVDGKLRMDPLALQERIVSDRKAGFAPFLVIATAGTTNAGAIDPIGDCAAIAAREGLWFHVDAAWGGAAALSSNLRPMLAGTGLADSITFDAHKWLSVPMGAGLYLTRHPQILHRTFATRTAYMPREAAALDVVDPHLHSMQWSRRFIGLKVFLSLAQAGWEGYEAAIDHMTSMGNYLRESLAARNWRILNSTALPVVCFDDAGGCDVEKIVQSVIASGEAWISATLLEGKRKALRACITNYRTQASDVDALVKTIEKARLTAG